MTMPEQTVDFNTKTGKFEITCPPWYVDKCRAIPNRRWLKKSKVWTAPPIVRNVEYLKSKFSDAVWTDAAERKADEVANARRITKPGFPSWYTFKRTPLSQQREALNAAYGMDAFAFIMDPGTCKTQTFIDWVCAYAMEGRINAALVIVPNSVTYNWLDELEDACPIDYVAEVMDTGSYRKAEKIIATTGVFKWLIMSWESLSQGKAYKYAERFMLSTRCALGADESSWAKNHKATRTDNAINLSHLANVRAILTGTVILSKLYDMYSQFEIVDTNVIGIGDFYAFRNRYVEMGGYRDDKGRPKQVVGFKNVDELMELIRPFSFVKKKRDCLDLPPRIPEESPPGILRRTTMTSEQRKLYKEVKSKYKLPKFDGQDVPIQNVLEKCLRLQQIIQGIVSVDTGRKDKHGKAILEQRRIFDDPMKNPKIRELINLIEEIDGQVVIYSPFVYNIEDITAVLLHAHPSSGVANLPKGDAEELQQVARDFRKGNYRFMVCSQKQGGIGLNFQSASDTIYLGNTQNLGDRVQSEARTERMGQKGDQITFWDIVCDDSEDTKTIMPSLREKMDLSEFVRNKMHEGAREEDLM